MKADSPLGDLEGGGDCHSTTPYVLISAQAGCQLSSQRQAKAGGKKSGYSGYSTFCPLIPKPGGNPRAFQMILAKLFSSIYPPAVLSVA